MNHLAHRKAHAMSLRTAAVAIAALAIAASAGAQEMAAPRYAVGDKWAYRETDLLTKLETAQLAETVTTADSTEAWIDARRTARTWWRIDTASKVAREQFAFNDAAADQRGKLIASNDAGCAYPWPLKVGMKFECTENTLWPNGWKVRYDLKFTVEAAESIETPAGRFDTLRLVAKGFANNETTNAISRQERIYWFAPAVKREVRHEIRTILKNNTVFKAEGRELVAFSAGGG